MGQVNHIIAGKKFAAENNQLSFRSAAIRKVLDNETKTWWVWYTMGADLAPVLSELEQRRMTLGDPRVTNLYMHGYPINKREIVPLSKGEVGEQAIANVDGENDYPRFMANQPVCYTRENDGKEWLVYSRGPHMRHAIDELWKHDKCVVAIEVLCTEQDDSGQSFPMMYQGKRVFRRMVVHKDSPLAVKPTELQ